MKAACMPITQPSTMEVSTYYQARQLVCTMSIAVDHCTIEYSASAICIRHIHRYYCYNIWNYIEIMCHHVIDSRTYSSGKGRPAAGSIATANKIIIAYVCGFVGRSGKRG